MTEILVVMTVIAVLSALVFSVFSGVREKGRKATCASNMKQLGMALLQYSQDYDERHLSSNKKLFQGASFNLGWAGRIYPYAKNMQIFQCPTDSTPATQFEGSTQTAYPVSYGININLSYELSLASLRAPAKTVMLFEISGNNAEITRPLEGLDEPEDSRPPHASAAGDGVQSGLLDMTKSSAISQNPEGPLYATGYTDNHQWRGAPDGGAYDQFRDDTGRHGGGANYLCADGHVKWLTGDKVSAGQTAHAPESSQSIQGCDGFTRYVAGRAPCAAGTSADNHSLTFSVK